MIRFLHLFPTYINLQISKQSIKYNLLINYLVQVNIGNEIIIKFFPVNL